MRPQSPPYSRGPPAVYARAGRRRLQCACGAFELPQHLRRLMLTELAAGLERCVSSIILRIHLRIELRQHVDRLHLPRACCIVHSAARRRSSRIPRILVRAELRQQLDRVYLPTTPAHHCTAAKCSGVAPTASVASCPRHAGPALASTPPAPRLPQSGAPSLIPFTSRSSTLAPIYRQQPKMSRYVLK
jgi:hypothetical protein